MLEKLALPMLPQATRLNPAAFGGCKEYFVHLASQSFLRLMNKGPIKVAEVAYVKVIIKDHHVSFRELYPTEDALRIMHYCTFLLYYFVTTCKETEIKSHP